MIYSIKQYYDSRPYFVPYEDWYRWGYLYFGFPESDLKEMDEYWNFEVKMMRSFEDDWRSWIRTVYQKEDYQTDPEYQEIAQEKLQMLLEQLRTSAKDTTDYETKKKEYYRFAFSGSSQTKKEDVKARNKIENIIGEDIQLRRVGKELSGRCPFHSDGREHTPSFSVSPIKQVFNCFGCGASGDVFGYVMKKYNFDFKQSLDYLSKRL